MITKTRDKLNEAKFFLNYMEETQKRPDVKTQATQDAFRYFLNAFLLAFRSATKLPSARNVQSKNYRKYDWVLEKEYGDAEGFDSWYQEKYEELKNDKVFQFLKVQRDRGIHFSENESVKLEVYTSVHALDPSRYRNPIPPSKSLIEIPGLQTDPYGSIFTFTELGRDICPTCEVVYVCTFYLAKLEEIVDECESRFLCAL